MGRRARRFSEAWPPLLSGDREAHLRRRCDVSRDRCCPSQAAMVASVDRTHGRKDRFPFLKIRKSFTHFLPTDTYSQGWMTSGELGFAVRWRGGGLVCYAPTAQEGTWQRRPGHMS